MSAPRTVTTMHVSDPTRNDTWQMLLDLERQVRYYGKLADRYSLRYRAIRYLLLLGIVAEGAIVYFFQVQTVLLWTFGGLGAFILGFLTVFDAATNYAQVSADLRTMSVLCDDLKTETERLWRDIEAARTDDLQAEQRFNTLVDRWIRATQRINLEIHDHDNKQAARDAYKTVVERYAS